MDFAARSIWMASALALAAAPSAGAAAPRTLEKDAKHAARTCWFATMIPAGDPAPADKNADGAWFLIEAARADPGNVDPIERVQQIAAEVPKAADYEAIGANVPDLQKQCAARWPKSARSSPVRLPATTFEHEMVCYGVANLVHGMAESEAKVSGKSMMFTFVNPIIRRGEGILNDTELAKHGISSQEQVNAALSRAVLQAQSLGNLNTVLSYCLFG